MSRPIRVLLDLSLTTEGYSGIPQVTRLLYRMLRQMPELDVTGLMYCPRGTTAEHCFTESPVPGERIGNQALFLEALTSRLPPLSTHRFLREYQRAKRFVNLLIGPTRQQAMEPAFWDVLSRNYFFQTLGPEDLDIVRQGKFLLSTFSNRAMNYRWKLGLPAQRIDTTGFDFVIFQDSRIARLSPGTVPIVRYHDMIPLLRPDCLTARRTIELHHAALRHAVRDAAFVCNTANTERDLVGAYPQVRERCWSIPYPLSSAYYPQRDEELLATILRARRCDEFGEGPLDASMPASPYLLTVSTLEPRKNYASLVQAFSRLTARHKNGVKLVVVGNRGWKWEGLGHLFRPLIEKGQLIHLTNVSHEEMRVLYSHAQALVFVSYYEGFGLAPVEAMQCDVPVVLSDASSHRDVAGDAALYCNPYDIDSIRAALGQLLFAPGSDALRQSLIARGRRQLLNYQQAALQARWLELFEQLKPGLRPALLPMSSARLPRASAA
ncbi:MAG: glycosyltransferase family 4 protein [Gemmataceae bacterium]